MDVKRGIKEKKVKGERWWAEWKTYVTCLSLALDILILISICSCLLKKG